MWTAEMSGDSLKAMMEENDSLKRQVEEDRVQTEVAELRKALGETAGAHAAIHTTMEPDTQFPSPPRVAGSRAANEEEQAGMEEERRSLGGSHPWALCCVDMVEFRRRAAQ